MTAPDGEDHPGAEMYDARGENDALAHIVHQALNRMLGLETYILLVVGEPCPHGVSTSQLFSRGLNHEELSKVLVDVTSSHAAMRLNTEGDHP